MSYIWYPDLFFLINFVMDLMAFFTTAVCFRVPVRKRRLILAAAISGGCSTFLFYVLKQYLLFRILVHGVVNPLLVGLFFSPADVRDFLKKWGSTYLLLLLFGGIQIWMQQAFSGKAAAGWLSVGICALCGGLVIFFWKRRILDTSMVWVCLYWNQKKLKCRAYADTGNVLRDVYTKKAVNIIGRTEMEKVFGEELGKYAPRMIPYRTVGNQHGLLPVYTIDKLVIYTGDWESTRHAPVIGISEQGCMIGKSCCLLLNSEFCSLEKDHGEMEESK